MRKKININRGNETFSKSFKTSALTTENVNSLRVDFGHFLKKNRKKILILFKKR